MKVSRRKETTYKNYYLKAAFFAAFLSLSLFGNSVTLERDTIILDGITLFSEVSDEDPDSLYAEDLDTLLIEKQQDWKSGLDVSYSHGLAFNKATRNSELKFAHEFMGERTLLGKYSSFGFQFFRSQKRTARKSNSKISLGLAYTSWEQSVRLVFPENRLGEFQYFESNSKGSLDEVYFENDINLVLYPVDVSTERLIQWYVEMPITYFRKVNFAKLSLKSEFFLSCTPGLRGNSLISVVHLMNSNQIISYQTENKSLNNINFSSELGIRFSKQVLYYLDGFVQIGFRKNFTSAFNSDSPFSFNRNSANLAIGISFDF